MAVDDPKTLVSTAWLAAHLKDPDLRVLDGSWYLPTMQRNARAEFEAAHVPGARYFDIDDISDHRSELPHMVPPVEKFLSRMRAMGVGDGHQVVIYDGAGLFSAARVWWLLKLMGHTDVAVLDGGFPKWKAEGHPTEDMPPIIRDRHMMVRRQNQMVKDVTQVAAASKLGDHEIIDGHNVAGEPRHELAEISITSKYNVFSLYIALRSFDLSRLAIRCRLGTTVLVDSDTRLGCGPRQTHSVFQRVEVSATVIQ